MIVAGFYLGVVVFCYGFIAADRDWRSWWVPPLWLPLLAYGFVWGKHHNRRWFCRLTSHNWRPILIGVRLHDASKIRGRQCRRCWKIEEL